MRQKATIDYYQRFIDALENSPQTQKKYIRELNYYLKWCKIKDPNLLITDDLLDSPAKIREVEDQIIEYAKFLINTRKLGSATIHLSLFAIFNFYSINRINLDRKYVTKFAPARKKLHKDRSYTHEQILQLLNSPSIDLKQRVIVLLLASTGMRVGAIPSMMIGALTKVELQGYPSRLYKITVYEGESQQYYCFCSFECAQMLDQYLGYRQRFGEIIKPTSPLIREQFDPNDTFQVKHPRFLGLDTFRRMIDRMLWSSGLRIRTKKEDRHIHDVMRSHGFRKFAITQMVKSKIDYNVREYLVGHRHSLGLDVNYDRTSEEDRLQEYLKAMDLLTISPENRLRQEVQDKDNVIKVQLERKDKQISELMDFKKQMEVLLREPQKFAKMLTENKN
jgi:integrase